MQKVMEDHKLSIWSLIAQGGWWKSREIVQELSLDPDSCRYCLNTMLKYGYIARRDIPKEKREATRSGAQIRSEYAVLPDCRIPYGLTVDELMQTMGAK